jgi:dipeptidyl aminopeptidase/acylaminoacyl peptidase
VRDWPDGVWQLYRVRPNVAGSLVAADAPRERLTDFPDGLARFSVSPNGRHVVLMHARGGDENTQLTLIDLNDPAKHTSVLTDTKVQADLNVWLRDGSGFLYSANATSPTDFHVYRYDLGTGRSRSLVAKEGAWRARDVTDDGKRVLVSRSVSASESHLFELDAESGQLTEITIAPKQGTAFGAVVGYLPGERSVLLSSDAEGGRSRLYVRDLGSAAVRPAFPGLHAHELDGARINDRRDLVVVTTNEDGFSVLRAYGLPGFKPLALPAIDRGVVSITSFPGSTLVYTLNNARQPGTGYALTLVRSGATPLPRAVTAVDHQGVDLAAFPLPQLVRYKSFDGREIPALLYRPPGHVEGTRIPFVITYHGGPESQSRPTFNATNQYLLSRGFGVLLPNVRGSTGYGRAYQMLDDYKKRWDSVKDGVAAAQWLVESGHASAGKIAAMGGSYGGFMSVACVVEDQEAVERGERKERLFGACVDVVGIVNMKTFLERTSGYRRKLREAEYGPLTDAEFLNSVSSIHRADKIQVPVFIAHGFNDPRVPVEEAMQLAAALRAKGRRPRMFIAPDEGHGFQKLDNRIYYGERLAAFLEETLKGEVEPRARTVSAAED